MRKFILGIGVGVAISAVCFIALSLFAPKPNAAQELELDMENLGYSYVDFKYKDLVLYDIGIKVNNELYVRPDKLMTFLGKEIQYNEGGAQLLITERPENSVMSTSTAALGQTSQKTVGEQLSEHFTAQHWEADPEVEGKLVFTGTDLSRNQYEMVFLINKAGEMTIQSISLNGALLSEDAKTQKIKELFGEKQES